MWANAQRDGRPAEYRWRPLFNNKICNFIFYNTLRMITVLIFIVLSFSCVRAKFYARCEQCIINFSERELTFMFAIFCRPSVRLSSVCSL